MPKNWKMTHSPKYFKKVFSLRGYTLFLISEPGLSKFGFSVNFVILG